MFSLRALTASASLALAAVLAAPADAQAVGIHFGQQGGRTSFDLALDTRAPRGLQIGYSHGSRGSAIHAGRPAPRGRALGHDSHIVRSECTRRVWIPGRTVLREQRVYVQASKRKVYVEPLYEATCGAHGRRVDVLVRDGYWKVVEEPGHWEVRQVEVWEPGHWEVIRTY